MQQIVSAIAWRYKAAVQRALDRIGLGRLRESMLVLRIITVLVAAILVVAVILAGVLIVASVFAATAWAIILVLIMAGSRVVGWKLTWTDSFWATLAVFDVALAVTRGYSWFLPATVLLAAGLALTRADARRNLRERLAWGALEKLQSLTPELFERHVAEFYRRLGCTVTLTQPTHDQGADLIAEKPCERLAVQCKQWSTPVGNSAVQEVLGARAFYGCTGAAVVTTSRYTPDAVALAQRADVQLIDGEDYAKAVVQLASLDTASRQIGAWDVRMPVGIPRWVTIGLLAAAVVHVLHSL